MLIFVNNGICVINLNGEVVEENFNYSGYIYVYCF